MNLATLLERFGEPVVLGSGGLLVGLLFGFFAQRSRFCLRAAVVEFWRGQPGEKLAVWLLALLKPHLCFWVCVQVGRQSLALPQK